MSSQAYKCLRAKLDEIDREEAFQSWVDHGQPPFPGTILEWYQALQALYE